ncbi:MAG: ABC transporter permease [Bacteroidota bacterium]
MTEEIIDSSERKLYNWRELWRYRELFYFFTWRDVKLRYKQTVLGFAWALLQPLATMTIIVLTFGRAVKIPPQSVSYPVFVLSGLVIWNFFATGLTGASQGMVTNAPIINKIYFPRLVIPVAAVLVSLFDFVIALTLLIIVLVWQQSPVDINALYYWPAAMISVIVATMGLGCGFSALNIKYRDIRYVIPFMIQLLFFLTPVIYPISMINYPVMKYILAMSPSYAPVELFRIPLTGVMPDMTLVSMSLCSAVVFLVAGILYFRNTEDYFADYA